MPLPPLDLDDRSWADLIDEARATIPSLATAWTDHNVHDPGITLVELLAYLVEQDVYRVNRVPERHRRAFLALAGFAPEPPRPARVVLGLALGGTTGPLEVPAGTPLTGSGIPFRTLTGTTVTDAALHAVQVFDGAAFADATGAWRDGLTVVAFGPDPAAATAPALYLGFDPPPSAGTPLTLWLETGATVPDAGLRLAHHDVRCAWECWDGAGWATADARDQTRCLTISGSVRLTPDATVASVIGAVPSPLHWIRCRLAEGRPDAAPALTAITEQAVTATQVLRLQRTFPIAPGTMPDPGAEPVPGITAHLRLGLDPAGRITTLAVADDPALPRAAVLDYRAATADAAGALTVELVLLGSGSGRPEQRLRLPEAPVANGRARVWLVPASGAAARRVRLVANLDAAGPQDDHAVLDAQTGELRFGDGLHGRVPPVGVAILAAYETTLAARGNIAAGADWAGAVPARNPLPARGGSDAEDLGPPTLRASAALWAHERLLELPAPGSATLDGLPRDVVLGRPAPPRLVTGADAERLAFATPGAHVERARAWAGVDGWHPVLSAPGTLTVVVLPALPVGRPEPSAGLIAAVECFLDAHRTLGTRVRVVGPEYLAVELSVRVAPLPALGSATVRAAVDARLRAFLHPLHGGADGNGWPFGRDIARSELLAVAESASGVDHVDALVLHGCGRDRCDVLPIPPASLPDLVALDVEVVA